jgi:MFS family permease
MVGKRRTRARALELEAVHSVVADGMNVAQSDHPAIGRPRAQAPIFRAEAGGAERGLPWALRAFKHRNYRLFFGGQLISLIGTWMQSVAQSWLVYRLTGSAALLGLVGFSSQIPVLLLASVGGAFADRHRRHRILVVTQTSSMLLAGALAILTLSHHIQVWHICTIAVLLGTVNAFDIPTRQAFIVEMVGREDLVNAIALNSSMFNSARILGPALGGVLVASIGEGWCFLGNSVSYLAVIAGLLAMRLASGLRAARAGSALASIVEGFRFAWRTRPIRSLLMLLALVSLMGMPFMVLMPIFADKILHGGPRGLGMLMGASGVGALTGALILAARRGVRGLGRWVPLAAAGFGTSLIFFSLSRSFWLSAALLVPAGFCMVTEMAASNTLVQSMVPDELRGRVMAVYSMMFMGVAPFGALIAGQLAQRLGAPTTVKIGGAVCIIGAMLFGLRLASFGQEAGRMIVALQMAGGDPAEAATGEGGAVTSNPEKK